MIDNQADFRRLTQPYDELDFLKDQLEDLGASEDVQLLLINAVSKGHISVAKAIELAASAEELDDRTYNMFETSVTGGGAVNGATFQAGAGEQYAAPMRTKKKLNEALRYNEFKKQTTYRTHAEQLHYAAKAIKQKLDELAELLEYTSQMKQELAESGESVKQKKITKKIYEKIYSRVVDIYTQVRELKND